MTGVSGVQSRKLWQVMDWITRTNHADIEFVVLINEEFWQGLNDSQRGIIQTAAVNAELAVRDQMSQIEAEAYKAAEENGMQVQTLDSEEIEQWRTATQPVLDNYLETTGELGKQVAEAAQKLRQ
jgi:C4-dicarboxylate-binding protein DctP